MRAADRGPSCALTTDNASWALHKRLRLNGAESKMSDTPSCRQGRAPRIGARLLVALLVSALPGLLAAAEMPCQERGTPPGQLVENARAAGQTFVRVDPLGSSSRADGALKSAIRDGSVLRLDPAALAGLRAAAPKTITLVLPSASGRTVELELVKVDVVTPDFKVVSSDSRGAAVPYTGGLHYRGVVKGDAASLAAVSVFADEIMGIYRSATDGTVVLGRLGGDNERNDHVLYAERDLVGERAYTCGTREPLARDGSPLDADDFAAFQAFQHEPPAVTDAVLARCVRIYVEADYDIFQNKGSTTAVTNYVTGVFNQSATLYSNDSVPISLSQVFVWSTPSPYTSTSSSGLLSQFQSFRNSFNGDLGHLIAFHGGGGIAAGFNGFCNANIDNRQCFSGIQSTFNNVPTYSWTVEVFTHEMGHLMGSRHTHACVWNGNNTAIDGCSTPEGSCARPGIPSGGGTIMSYCHQQSVGINFNNGFGTQPGNVIRNRFASASCLTDCGGGPPPPPTCTTYTGSLSGTGASAIQPNGTYYFSSASGTHRGHPERPVRSGLRLVPAQVERQRVGHRGCLRRAHLQRGDQLQRDLRLLLLAHPVVQRKRQLQPVHQQAIAGR